MILDRIHQVDSIEGYFESDLEQQLPLVSQELRKLPKLNPLEAGQFYSIIYRGLYLIGSARKNYEKDLAKLFTNKLRKFAMSAPVPDFVLPSQLVEV